MMALEKISSTDPSSLAPLTFVGSSPEGKPDDFIAQVESYRLRLRGNSLTMAIALVTGSGFMLFGYDPGVMSSILTTKSFEATFPEVVVDDTHRSHAALRSFLVSIYQIGCLAGALSNLWIVDRLGQRRTIILGCSIMIIGAILQATSFSYVQMLVARVVTGCGNGLNTSTIPSYHAECSPAKQRGRLVMIEGSLITLGITVGYWVDFAFYWINSSSAQWRVPVALQICLAVAIIIGIGFLPESPRWLVKTSRPAEAMAVVSALENRPPTDENVRRTFEAIQDAVHLEELAMSSLTTVAEKNGSARTARRSFRKRIFSNGRSQNLRRLCLGASIQCFQQLTGINIISYYATILFEGLQISDTNSRIIAACNATEYFLASLVAIYLVESVGRRRLLLFGSFGQTICMVLLAVLGYIGNPASRIVSAVLLFVFNSFFAVGWLGLPWLYPAEITSLEIRGPANALSTASNWTFNFLVIMVTGPAFETISWRTYIVFAALNAAIIFPVYLFFPETAGRSLEDMDVIFALAYDKGASPVEVSLRSDIPPAGSEEANIILGLGPNTRVGRGEERSI